MGFQSSINQMLGTVATATGLGKHLANQTTDRLTKIAEQDDAFFGKMRNDAFNEYKKLVPEGTDISQAEAYKKDIDTINDITSQNRSRDMAKSSGNLIKQMKFNKDLRTYNANLEGKRGQFNDYLKGIQTEFTQAAANKWKADALAKIKQKNDFQNLLHPEVFGDENAEWFAKMGIVPKEDK